MAYHFKRKESVSKAVCRLCHERIDDAIGSLRNGNNAAALHGVRKDIKKTRAVLRLVRTRIGRKQFRRPIRRLRKAAAVLAAPRDAYIKTQTIRKLIAHFKGKLASGALRHVRSELHRGCGTEMRRFAREKSRRVVERQLRRARAALSRLTLRSHGWRAIGPGVKATYRAGRQAYRAAAERKSPESLHAWRKRAKDLWYQMRLLSPLWPEQMDATASELDQLGELLGDDHDLMALRKKTEGHRMGSARRRELELLYALIDERHGELCTAALALGARFYAERPADFCARLAGYWRTWRRRGNARLPGAVIA